MPRVIEQPSIVKAAGNLNKTIEEFAGRINSGDKGISIARMQSPEGWTEPGQRPEFDEYSLVITGMLKVETEHGSYEVRENQLIIIERGEWVRYSTPGTGGAEYISVCVPAFSPDTVNRDETV